MELAWSSFLISVFCNYSSLLKSNTDAFKQLQHGYGYEAYEVALKRSITDDGNVVLDSVVTTGRVIVVVIDELPHQMAAVKIED